MNNYSDIIKLRNLALTNITHIDIPIVMTKLMTINIYDKPDNYVLGFYGIFEDCSQITSITIPTSITDIHYRTFKNCKSLISLTIPDSVIYIYYNKINDSIVEGCDSLEYLYIPDHLIPILSDNDKELYYRLYNERWNKELDNILYE